MGSKLLYKVLFKFFQTTLIITVLFSEFALLRAILSKKILIGNGQNSREFFKFFKKHFLVYDSFSELKCVITIKNFELGVRLKLHN